MIYNFKKYNIMHLYEFPSFFLYMYASILLGDIFSCHAVDNPDLQSEKVRFVVYVVIHSYYGYVVDNKLSYLIVYLIVYLI